MQNDRDSQVAVGRDDVVRGDGWNRRRRRMSGDRRIGRMRRKRGASRRRRSKRSKKKHIITMMLRVHTIVVPAMGKPMNYAKKK